MTALTKTFVVEAKLFLREPAAVFFTLLLPLLLLVLSSSAGIDAPHGTSAADILLPGYITMVIATAGIMALPETIASYRERGILRRLRATPLVAWKVLAAHGGVQLVVTVAGLAVLVVAAALTGGLHAPKAPVALVVALLLGLLSTLSIGFLLAAVLPTTRTTRAVAAALYFPLIFLSGAVFPRDQLPDLARRIGDFLPLTYAVRAIREAWSGAGIDWAALAVLVLVTVAAGAVCTRTFRWE